MLICIEIRFFSKIGFLNEFSKERASNNLVNFKTRPARLKQNLAGQEQRPNWILTWQVFF